MAGVKGRSGGKREGAGRKPGPKPPPPVPVPVPLVDASGEPVDMLKLLQNVALGLLDATPLQVRAAIAAVQYTHTKRGDGGKKEEAAEKAKKAGSKFAPAAAPLKLVGRN